MGAEKLGSGTYGGGLPLTVDLALQQPEFIARSLSTMLVARYWAGRLLTEADPKAAKGGAVRYGVSESKFADKAVEEMAVRAMYPRASSDRTMETAEVGLYGLEFPINDIAFRRSQAQDEFARGMVKLANSLVRQIDTVATTAILAAPLLTGGGADWGTDGRVFTDLTTAKAAILNVDEGYDPNVLLVQTAQWEDLMSDGEVREAWSREDRSNPAMSGEVPPFFGLDGVYRTNDSRLAGTAILAQAKILGSIAFEQPDEKEGFSTYQPEAETGVIAPPVNVKVYRDEATSDWVIRVHQSPVVWIPEPKAGYKITGV